MEITKIDYERLFKITRIQNTISLSGSMSFVNGEFSEENFENEVFQITFFTHIQGVLKEFNLLVVANECIDKGEKEGLQRKLGIAIEGDGMCFKICAYKQAFKMQFDTLKSTFLNTHSVKNGLVLFGENNYYKHFTK
ncbi:hypothetical protein CXF68_04490 [Tenacibaculum sp. Bg11-29]|uniref:hypothetical protein n=1 Tax=Tenacibaculum sp. Bg11-29 TaxID=2058306 RepID=UPI000C332DCE|nr:hypothetical protein [Tenacibaculum sp. Bg11-29]PKH50006.1 hypothetical protein CXF68_04490 [Tenacibaculum sp. Bg11-29]